jgi:GxxExxY protein
MLHADLTEQIIKAFYKVYNTLGYGFLEKVYENALLYELKNSGLAALQQESIKVFYDGCLVGDYYADLLVNDLVIVELKALESLRQEHIAQLTNYCKATGVEVGLLLNFGKNPEVKRVLFTKQLAANA